MSGDGAALTPVDLAEAAALMRSLLALVEAGDLEARTPGARMLLRRLEGAALAAELASGSTPKEPDGPDSEH